MKQPVIGVTGLPCAGKSLAAELLADGAVNGVRGVLLKADDIGHAVLVRPDVVERLRKRFGAEAFRDDDPAAIRRAIAERVFASPGELAWLETLVHPLVVAEVDRITGEAAGLRPVVVEAALLFAANMDRNCDRVLVVEADFEVRLARAARRGWDRAELERRERRQLPLFEAAFSGPARGKLAFVRNDADDGRLAERIRAVL